MAPIRRYLRITKYSVLECRIYLENPALAQTWLLNPRNPILPRVIESIRPLVLPKLREDKERSKKKSTRKKQIKDVIVKDDFEVSMFLTETSTRHSLLSKHKHFREKAPAMMQSNSTKLIGETNATPFEVDDDAPAVLVEEESDDEGLQLADIPIATSTRQRKRTRNGNPSTDDGSASEATDREDAASGIEVDSDAEQDAEQQAKLRQPKRLRGAASLGSDDADDEDEDDKKKLAMDVSYEGFAIYGRVLCLVIKKRDSKTSQTTAGSGGKPSGQARMENWISSTQIPVGEEAS